MDSDFLLFLGGFQIFSHTNFNLKEGPGPHWIPVYASGTMRARGSIMNSLKAKSVIKAINLHRKLNSSFVSVQIFLLYPPSTSQHDKLPNRLCSIDVNLVAFMAIRMQMVLIVQ